MTGIAAAPLDATTFAPFGDVIAPKPEPDFMINGGRCGRHHDLAALSFDTSGRAGISIFDSQPVSLPYDCTHLERHPLGSQTFIPLSPGPYLVIVAPDHDGAPGTPVAFIATGGEGVNYRRGTWHGILAPLDGSTTFAVIDWIGDGANLEEFVLPVPARIVAAPAGKGRPA